MRFIHLSDLHFRGNWNEEEGQVLAAFLKDVRDLPRLEDTYVIFSGDVVHAGGDIEQYERVESSLLKPLAEFGLGPDRIIMCPGNHDVDRHYVKDNIDSSIGLSLTLRDETQANNFIARASGALLSQKFTNYAPFEACNSAFGCGPTLTGAGYTLPDGTGVYCLNSAILSLAGQPDSFGAATDDRGLLAIETRGLNTWLQNSDHRRRVLVLHHPADWLMDWANTELRRLVQNNFDVCVHGHVHQQDVGLTYHSEGHSVWITSPALFTRKHDILGYSIFELTDKVEITYRQWSPKFSKFVAGTAFSGSDTGTSLIPLNAGIVTAPAAGARQKAADFFDAQLKSLLKSYGPQDPVWVTPDVSQTPEKSRNVASAIIFEVDTLLARPDHIMIKAPPQYGLSACALYLGRHYASNVSDSIVFLETDKLPGHETGVLSAVELAMKAQTAYSGAPGLILLDGFVPENQGHARKFKNLRKVFPDARLIAFHNVDDAEKIEKPVPEPMSQGLSEWYLWALSRAKVRVLVKKYIEAGSKLQEDPAVNRVTEYLDTLNLPRTPHNCLTLLTIFESQVDATPVNRTEVMGLFLQSLFATMQGIPKYNNIPDLKDSLFALGYICEDLIRRQDYGFQKVEFFNLSEQYCKSQLIEIEIDTLFLMLCACNMLVQREGRFYFRFVYWINFFAAHRMHHSEEFYDYMMHERRYADYPEIIEFYSGIDRRSTEMLSSLLNDLDQLNATFELRTGFSDSFSGFDELEWVPSEEAVTEVRNSIEAEVSTSRLPLEVKDLIADRDYDRSKPYTQEISHFIDDSSMFTAVRVMKCAARALRNSDHADVEVRRRLLEQIMLVWAREVRLIAILSPLLANDGIGEIDGLHYYLTESFDKYEGEEKWVRILSNAHFNVSNFYNNQLYSAKLGPLFLDYLEKAEDDDAIHLMVTLLVREKPKSWQEAVSRYVEKKHKNSFYLSNTARELKRSFDIGFDSEDDKARLRELVGLAYGKHYRANHPGRKLIEHVASHVLDKKKVDPV